MRSQFFGRCVYKSQLDLFIQQVLKGVTICMKTCSCSAKKWTFTKEILLHSRSGAVARSSTTFLHPRNTVTVLLAFAHQIFAVGKLINVSARISAESVTASSRAVSTGSSWCVRSFNLALYIPCRAILANIDVEPSMAEGRCTAKCKRVGPNQLSVVTNDSVWRCCSNPILEILDLIIPDLNYFSPWSGCSWHEEIFPTSYCFLPVPDKIDSPFIWWTMFENTFICPSLGISGSLFIPFHLLHVFGRRIYWSP